MQRLSPITAIFLMVTENCNLRCRYCFIKQHPVNMSLEVALDAVRWVIASAEAVGKTPTIHFFGGEPTLRWDEIIVPVTEWVRNEYKKPCTLGITTNGVLLTQERIDYMVQNGIGCLFSIDGPKEIQDLHRPLKGGGSSFDVLLPKIPMILQAWPNMTFRSTFDHDDRDVLVPIHKFAIEQGYNNVFCVPNNLSEWTEEEKEHLRQQMRDLTDYWIELFRAGTAVSFNPLGRALGEIRRINKVLAREGFRDENTNLAAGKCGLGATAACSVSHNGNLYSCQELVGNEDYAEQFYVGNIYTGIDNERRLEIASQFCASKVRSSKEGRCANCKLNPICTGYCSINNVMKNNDIHVLPEISCIYYETAVDEMIRLMNTMAAEENETFRTYYTRMVNRGNRT